jgi:NAD(P)-dependent dehydrogenase (short-subunit alcohol dehydrogenase family)
MMLKDKVAVIYGAGGAIGGAVARAFASEGADVYLTGRHGAPVEAVAEEIVSAGGSAQAAEVDALDEQAVDEHLQAVIDTADRVDISFNAVGSPDANVLGVPLVELDVEKSRRLMTLEEMANVAVFMASDKASGMTGSIVNLTMGILDD